MKYIKYFLVIIWTLIRKVIGVPVQLLTMPFRAYSRNVVYNYVLANDIYLQRLVVRPITRIPLGYIIKPYHGTDGGYINKRLKPISKLEYWFAYYLIWQWQDDDSVFDTWSREYTRTLVEDGRMTWLPKFIIKHLQYAYDNQPLYGNSFDLGDKRGDNPSFYFWASLLWAIRNTAYNSKYMTWEKTEGDKDIFYIKLPFGWGLGWKARDVPQLINGKVNYDLVFLGWN